MIEDAIAEFEPDFSSPFWRHDLTSLSTLTSGSAACSATIFKLTSMRSTNPGSSTSLPATLAARGPGETIPVRAGAARSTRSAAWEGQPQARASWRVPASLGAARACRELLPAKGRRPRPSTAVPRLRATAPRLDGRQQSRDPEVERAKNTKRRGVTNLASGPPPRRESPRRSPTVGQIPRRGESSPCAWRSSTQTTIGASTARSAATLLARYSGVQ